MGDREQAPSIAAPPSSSAPAFRNAAHFEREELEVFT
jgi:hypothetical protein